MIKFRNSTAFKQFRKNLILLTIFSFMSFGCRANEQKTEEFKPLVNGLTSGHYSKETGCVTVNRLSAKLEPEDFNQLLQVFSGADCKSGSLLFKKTLSIESQIAGFWNNYIVIDEGTDPNGRELHIYNTNDKSVSHTFYYTLMPIFKGSKLSYMMPLEIAAKPDECAANKKHSVKEWKRLKFELELAEERIFDLTTGKTTTTNKRKCFPLQ